MTQEEFVKKWKAVELKERSAAQEHFIDLCRMLGEETPAEADPKGEWYCFERGATKTTGGEGWADVWKRNCFGWEYKGKRKDLEAAYVQLQQYAPALENPPLLVVCDMDRFRIHTNWTSTVAEVHEFALDGLLDARNVEKLKWVMSAPERLRPALTRDAVTAEMAATFGEFAAALGARGLDALKVAHFVNRMVFCMFAEDIGLLPNDMFKRMLEHSFAHPTEFEELAGDLFKAMRSGGRIGYEKVEWFNGGLFDDDEALPLARNEIALVLKAAKMNWSAIDPSIFGTLFERGLDPSKRSQLGAHYTSRDKIMRIIEPVVVRPLVAEWDAVKARIAVLMEKASTAKAASTRTKAKNEAEDHLRTFLERLREFRVLDPACGSGNFLYLSLLALKDLEHRVGLEAETFGFARAFPSIGPEAVKGIEINPYAAELARVTIWIGDIQWQRRNGYAVGRRPILRSLNNIENRDAVLAPDDTAAAWPDAEVVVGNPPFVGDKQMLSKLPPGYPERLRNAYKGRVPGGADFVTYWHERAREEIVAGRLKRAGLVSTNTIRGGRSRQVLDAIQRDGLVFYDAWSTEDWDVDGAAVDVSLICFAPADDPITYSPRLDGVVVDAIHSDLTGAVNGGGDRANLTLARAMAANVNVSYLGIQKTGRFDVPGEMAREWLKATGNPNGRPNSDVLKPYWNGLDLTRRPRDWWLIDVPLDMSEVDAACYEAPFAWLDKEVRPTRVGKREQRANEFWWQHYWPRPEMRAKIAAMPRHIVTPEVSKWRLFAWMAHPMLPDKNLVVITRDDDLTFGILHSRFHEAWALRVGTSLEDRPRYTSSTTFMTFPFPDGMTPDIPATDALKKPAAQRIAAAARALDARRRAWLNPADMVVEVDEVAPGYPKRLLPKNDKAAKELTRRTLTKLYNEAPPWLRLLHAELDRAVAAAYGWPEDIDIEMALARLLELNLSRPSIGDAAEGGDADEEDETDDAVATGLSAAP